ncbi:hypothetical protein Patl1_29900 [Pistacia atlantica]|uniref:Uncharacterized protein n=1 Tax=Pistacia atlantica TaxID=434234 RepID=A0ACC1ACB7_9ROSI|nr:hypothetical protein Patl1_29900 [Pistacia atlantica]
MVDMDMKRWFHKINYLQLKELSYSQYHQLQKLGKRSADQTALSVAYYKGISYGCNLEARRRISFFSNSLFMDMPLHLKFATCFLSRGAIWFILHAFLKCHFSCSVLTPYYSEEVLFCLRELESPNEDGVSILFYLQKIFPDEWNNFLERVKCLSKEELRGSDELEEEFRVWASYRGQTLARTDLMESYKAIELNVDDNKGERSLVTQCQAVPDMKFTYVVSCQQYGIHKQWGHPRAQFILRLMTKYPSLRVAYIDEVEKPREDSVSSLAWLMSNQETSFVTIGQRLLAKPLRVRFHYGHPDVFDRLFHLTRGGVSKASQVINLSEDIFAGFNFTIREGSVTHHEYIQVGKGRDVGLNQISMFEAKIANGSGEQTLSRDIYRLGHQFDFFLMLSCYFTTIGFYLSTLAHYYRRTLLHGGAKYRSTGRGFVVFHTKFADDYRLYFCSHFVKGIEMMIMLIVYQIFGQSYRGAVAYILITISMWFMVGTWLFVPFLFNPSGFEWQKIVDDWTDWNKWIRNRGDFTRAKIQCIFPTLAPNYEGDSGALFSLRYNQFDSGFTWSFARKYCVYFCFRAHWFGECLLIAQALKPLVQRAGFWELVRTFAYCYEIVMGLLLFTVVHSWRGFLSSRYSRLVCSLAKRLQRSADFLYSRRPKERSHFLKQ